jgi:hypothetical protein
MITLPQDRHHLVLNGFASQVQIEVRGKFERNE